LAAAQALAASGARLVINGRSAEACRKAIEAIAPRHGDIEFVAGSIADEAVADRLVERCIESFGHVSFVLNNAGITRDRSLMKMTACEFDEVIAVHLRGTWLVCRAAARSMRTTGGSILNVTSGSALFGLVGQSNYAAAKGGIIALTRALSVELARYRIHVNALYPVALTDMTAPVLELSGSASGPFSSVFGAPADVAGIVVALSQPEVSITSQVLAFDGSELPVWSHPEQLYRVRHSAPWTESLLAQALTEVSARPAELHPDAVGIATREALRGNRQ
jgi:NAD(P)-dependent dehydrogenase (short-subunit alcohol dehydrogenase family)